MADRSKDNLETLLKVNMMLSEANMDLLRIWMKQTIYQFGGILSFLQNLSKIMKHQQLKSMHQMMSIQQRKYQNDNETSKKVCQQNNGNIVDSFHYLPNECITHICGYLNKANISSFKSTSRQIAIVCLEEMKKITIFSIYLNTISNLYNFNYTTKAQHTRHSIHRKLRSIREEWSKQYNMNENDLLIFGFTEKPWRSVKLLDCSDQYYNRQYLLIDGRKLTIIDDDKIIPFDPKKHRYGTLKAYRLIVVQYFDLMKQTMQIVGCFMYSDTRKNLADVLIDYIRSKCINNDTYPWNSLLKQVMMKTGNSTISKQTLNTGSYLKFYFHPAPEKISLLQNTPVETDEHFVTFQLSNEPTYNQWSDIHQKSLQPRLEKFEWMAPEFCRRMKTRTIAMQNTINELGEELKKYYDNKMNEEERNKYQPVLRNILKACQHQQISMEVNNSSYPGLLRQKMRKLLMNEVELKNIELRDTSQKILPENELISRCKENIHCTIVLYNTLSVKPDDVLYRLQIYTPSNGPHPYLDLGSSISIDIRFSSIRSSYLVMDLVKHVFKTIEESARQILYHKYKQLLAYKSQKRYRYNIAHSTNESCRIQQYKPYPGSYSVDIKHLCPQNQYVLSQLHVMNLDLYIMEHEENKQLRIEFAAGAETRREDLKPVGLPLCVNIKEGDSLNDIIFGALRNNVKYIQSMYRIRTKDNGMIHITEDQYDEYHPYTEFEELDLLLIVVRYEASDKVKLYRYGY